MMIVVTIWCNWHRGYTSREHASNVRALVSLVTLSVLSDFK